MEGNNTTVSSTSSSDDKLTDGNVVSNGKQHSSPDDIETFYVKLTQVLDSSGFNLMSVSSILFNLLLIFTFLHAFKIKAFWESFYSLLYSHVLLSLTCREKWYEMKYETWHVIIYNFYFEIIWIKSIYDVWIIVHILCSFNVRETSLDLYLLYLEVTRRGGFHQVFVPFSTY